MLLNQFDSIDKLFITLTVIILTTNIIYQFMAKFNRPIVLGGIFAGIIINHLHIPMKYFDINTCAGLGQMGIVLFMMEVGNMLEFKNIFKRKSQMPITLLNVLLPFILGIGVATILIKLNWTGIQNNSNISLPGFTPDSKVTNLDNPKLIFMFKLFVGLAVSMTAFPILSMFLKSTDLVNSRIGRLALLCGLVDEVFFWLVLGVVLISVQQNAIITSFKPIDILFYLIFIIYVLPKLLDFCIKYIKSEGTMISFLIIGCFSSAALADAVDLHQVFGGFLFGLILPRDNELIKAVRLKLNEFVQIVFLPIYFVETGMVANIHISFNYMTILLIFAFSLIALAGKFSAGFLTGKLLNCNNHESAMLGSLLNIRGIIEIVLLNIGLDIGIIGDQIYTTLVGMTIICTFIGTTIAMYLISRHKALKL